MTNRFQTPSESFVDSTGTPYAGGFLYFYASGTSTAQATYSDSALSTPNANPVVLDSAGRAGSIFLQNLNYKVVLASSANVTIWTLDPVRTSDFSGSAQFAVYAGNPNGSVAGTAGSGAVPSSAIWDTVDNILYICTTTGTAGTAVWTGVNTPGTASVPPPQGYLTPTTATPIITTDAVGAATIYYTPFMGTLIPIYNGSAMSLVSFSELSCALASQHLASTIYDFFVFNNSGAVTLVTGPAWSASGANAGARGSGAGTTQLVRTNGLWTNAVQITGRNGATTYTIAANFATYVGSIYIDSTAGQTSCHRGYGQNRKWGLWNAFNRMPIYLKAGDATANWTYNTNTIRASNNVPSGAYSGTAFNVGSGTACNGLNLFIGLQEQIAAAQFIQHVRVGASGGADQQVNVGIGLNSITAFSGKSGWLQCNGTTSSTESDAYARHLFVPVLGLSTLASLETIPQTGGGTKTLNGTENNMVLSVEYLG